MNRLSLTLLTLISLTLMCNGETALANSGNSENMPLSQTVLLRQFNIENGRYVPADVKLGGMSNEIFLYIMTDGLDDEPRLGLFIQYCSDDPLRYTELCLTVDGVEYKFMTTKPDLECHKEPLYYYECSDSQLHDSDRDMIDALAHCERVSLKLVGKDGWGHVLKPKDKQRDDFRSAVLLYRQLGGTL